VVDPTFQEKILKYLQEGPHTLREIALHVSPVDTFELVKQLNVMEQDGLVDFTPQIGLYGVST
jgi:DNA-binding HxlR family transcriptional regulator